MNDAAAGPRMPAEAEVYQGQHQAREGNNQGNHLGGASTLGAPTGMGASRRLPLSSIDPVSAIATARNHATPTTSNLVALRRLRRSQRTASGAWPQVPSSGWGT